MKGADMIRIVFSLLLAATIGSAADIWVVLYENQREKAYTSGTLSGSPAWTTLAITTDGTVTTGTSQYIVEEEDFVAMRQFSTKEKAIAFIKGLKSDGKKGPSNVRLIRGENIPVQTVKKTTEKPQPPAIETEITFEVKQ